MIGRSGEYITLVDTRSGSASPNVTIAVSTRNRSLFIPPLLRSLEAQTLPRDRFEVVVVDDCSTDSTARVLADFASRSNLAVLGVRLERQLGQSGGRNVAWRAARGAVIAFTDDDCVPAPDWLERGLERLEPNTVLVGRTMPDPSLPLGPFSRTVQREDEKWVPTCNAFYWQQDLEAVGGFDEGYGALGCEDTDLGLRVRDELHRELRFGGDVLVHHDVRPSRFLSALRETQRWTTAARLFRAHPSARAWLHRRIFWHRSHPLALLGAAGVIAGAIFPPAVLLLYPWFRLRTTPPYRRPGRLRQVYPALPGTFLIDLAETVAVIRGAVKYRTLVI